MVPIKTYRLELIDWNCTYFDNKISTILICPVAQARAQSQGAQNGITPPNQGPNSASPNTRLMQMVQQVKEVLPQVPSPSIARDLSKLQVY